MRSLAVIAFILALVSPAGATIWCADAVNGSDANTGIAAGTLPSLTNCKKSAEAAAAILTSNDTLYMTGVFHHPNITDASSDMMAIPSSAANVTITSFGPVLWPGPQGADPASDASVSAILMGTYCLGTAKLSCSTMQNAPATWTLVSGSIYSTPITNYIYAVYSNDIKVWPDGVGGLKQAGCVSSCVDSVTNPSQLPVWLATHVYPANSDVQNGTTPAQWWHTTTGGTSASTPPTCASSCTAGTTTFTDNTITWVYEGNSAAVIGPMVAGSYYSDGQVLNVWEPDSSNPNTNVVEAAVQPYPIHVNSTTGNNGLTVTHLGMERFSAGPLIFDTSGSGACQAGFVFDRDYLTQTGTSNVDVGMFLNGFRFSGGDPTCVPAPTVTHSYISYIGEHGGGITGQVVGNGNFSYNNIFQCNHGCLNLTQNGTTSPGANIRFIGNYVHDSIKSQNANVATDSVGGAYCQYCTGLIVASNVFARFLDAGCGGGGQCACGNFAATTGTQFINNTCSGAQHMLSETSGFANTGLVARNNICDNMISEASTGSCFDIIAAANLVASNNNIIPGTTIALVNGVATNLSTWQNTYGFDFDSINSPATFWRVGWPFMLTAGSKGIGVADASQGYGRDIGAPVERLGTNLLPLPLQSSLGQGNY